MRTRHPFTLKEGPSGCVMYSGLTSVRSDTPLGRDAYSDQMSGGGIGTISRSLNIHTAPEPRSTAISIPVARASNEKGISTMHVQEHDAGQATSRGGTFVANTFNRIRVQVEAGRIISAVIEQRSARTVTAWGN